MQLYREVRHVGVASRKRLRAERVAVLVVLFQLQGFPQSPRDARQVPREGPEPAEAQRRLDARRVARVDDAVPGRRQGGGAVGGKEGEERARGHKAAVARGVRVDALEQTRCDFINWADKSHDRCTMEAFERI